MKYSVTTHQYGSFVFNTFDKVMTHFTNKFFQNNITEDGRTFLHDLGDYLDTTKYPCDKIKLDIFTGYNNRISLFFFYNDEKVSSVEIKFERYGILKISNYLYFKKDLQIFHPIIEEYFDNKNLNIYKEWLDKCNIHTDRNNEIKVEDYRDYKPNGEFVILSGSLEDIFDKYTTHNDRLKYCNGDFWRFANADIQTLYSLFIINYKGNYFLNNAVKRGVIID